MLGLPDRDLKAAMIKLLQWAIMKMLETNEKIESLIKEIEDTKKNQMEILG